jgi:hypothetical protein
MKRRVPTIRGVGFTPIVALLGLNPRPGIGGGGGGGAAGAAAGAATSTVTSVASVAAATAATAAVVIPTTASEPAPEDTATAPFSRPGGELTTGAQLTSALSVPIASRKGPPPASASVPEHPPGQPPETPPTIEPPRRPDGVGERFIAHRTVPSSTIPGRMITSSYVQRPLRYAR